MDFTDGTSIIAVIITALQAITLGYFQYNQYTKNKLTDSKIKEMEDELKRRKQEEQEAISRIYGYLWSLLIEVEADRVLIIQPHPPHDKHLISATLEAPRKGTASAKPHIKNIEMSEVAAFVGDISKRQFIYYPERKSCKDATIRAIMDISGASTMAIFRLEDADNHWCGSLCVDWTHKKEDAHIEYIKVKMADAAMVIQHILPRYEGTVK